MRVSGGAAVRLDPLVERKNMPTCEFEGCRKEFIRSSNNQRFCKRPECMQIRYRKQTVANSRSFREVNGLNEMRDMRKANNAIKKRCKNPHCKNKTINYFGFCDDCREMMTQGADPNIPLYMYTE
jgi:hypothetical protein